MEIKLSIIAAMAKNRVIGKEGHIPWYFPEDLKRFKALTLGNVVIMGRPTFESLPFEFRPLPDRTNVVLTNNPKFYAPAGVYKAHSIEEALDIGRSHQETYFIGGGKVYEQALPLVSRLELTEIHTDYEGDVYFPKWNREEWDELQRIKNDGFDFVTYMRKGK